MHPSMDFAIKGELICCTDSNCAESIMACSDIHRDAISVILTEQGYLYDIKAIDTQKPQGISSHKWMP